MPFWIAVHLPRLPLDALQPNWPDTVPPSAPLCAPLPASLPGAPSAPGSSPGMLHLAAPTVVIERERVVLANRAAMALGVEAGMRRGGVQALSADIVQLARDPAREAELMASVALALLRLTPHVVLDPLADPARDPEPDAGTVMLDVTASLRLFGGHRRLCREVRACVRGLGAIPQIGCGTTAHGAAWLARLPLRLDRRGALERPARRAIGAARMARLLDAMPVEQLHGLADPVWLDGVGCRTVGDVRRLPRAGLRRRVGAGLLARLDQAYGEAPVRFTWHIAPASFRRRMELPGRSESAAGILPAAQRLLLELGGWLAARHAGVTRFVLGLEHERFRHGAPTQATPVEIRLAQPGRDPGHLLRLLRERLDRLRFEAPVVGLSLEVAVVQDCVPNSESLFPEPGGTPEDLGRVLDTLSARLGRENVLQPLPLADHRPERANRWCPVDEWPGRASAPEGLGGLGWAAWPERPLWLLEPPRPLPVRGHRPQHGGPLTLLSRPERVEAGWWDGALAARDYFVAERADGLRCWIYRERPGPAEREGGEYRWFLHGLFA